MCRKDVLKVAGEFVHYGRMILYYNAIKNSLLISTEHGRLVASDRFNRKRVVSNEQLQELMFRADDGIAIV